MGNSIIDMIFGVWSSLGWLNVILAMVVTYLGRNKPARSTMMWVMVLTFLPIVGFFLYLLLGQDYRRAKMFRLKAEQDEMVRRVTDAQNREIQSGATRFRDPAMEEHLDLIRLALNADNAYYSESNEVQLFFDGEAKFAALFRDIEAAQFSVDVQYYILQPDELGYALLERLEAAARRGVRVRLLVDAVGGRRLWKRDFEPLCAAGGNVSIFFRSLIRPINFRINYRNHRKIVVVDNAVGYIGGFNVGMEYLGANARLGPWRDTHLRVEGDVVASLKLRFLKDWLYASGDNPADEPDVRDVPNPAGHVGMQLVTSGPDTPYTNIKYAMVQMIRSAKEAIYIQTPYLVPDLTFLDALTMALVSGVQVHIMIPNKPDHPFVYWATTSYAGMLLREGAKVYRYDAGFLHSKVLIVDNLVSMVGSANVDERSFLLNFEASMLLYDRTVNRNLRTQFWKDAEKSTLLTPERYAQRPLFQRIKEPIARLLSPLL